MINFRILFHFLHTKDRRGNHLNTWLIRRAVN